MASSSPRQPAVSFIFITVTLAIMGFGLLIPVLPRLIIELKGGDEVSGSRLYGVIVSVYAFMQFVGSPILGALSDRFGRRRIILIATAGSAIDYTVMALAPTIGWFFLARAIAGFTAGVLVTANAYIADVTPPEKRAGAFGILGAAFGLGFTIGPVIGGVLSAHDIRLPFWVAAGCSAANWLYGFFVLPESLAPENRRAFSWKRANPIGALAVLKRFPAVRALADGYFFLSLAQNMLFSTWVLYTQHRFHWDGRDNGLSLMVVGVLSAVVQAGLVRRVVPKLGEARSVLVGFGVTIIAYVCYGLATQGWMMYAIMVFGSIAWISGPALQSYITKHVPPDEQGAVQGIFGGLVSLAAIPAPIIASSSFSYMIEGGIGSAFIGPGVAFFEGAFLVLIAFVLTARCFARDAHAGAGTAPLKGES